MILADTSVWIDFLAGRASAIALRALLAANQTVCHPAVRGEIALGSIARRDEVLRLLSQLPRAPVIGDDEVFAMIETKNLDASGIGWIDAHLLASAMAGRHLIWTGDKRLASVAARLSPGGSRGLRAEVVRAEPLTSIVRVLADVFVAQVGADHGGARIPHA